MLKSIKKSIVIFAVGVMVLIPGCKSYNYNESQDDKWIIQQIEKGTLTTEEVQAIKAQEKSKE